MSYIKQAYDRKFDICKCKSEGQFATRQFTIFQFVETYQFQFIDVFWVINMITFQWLQTMIYVIVPSKDYYAPLFI